MARPSAACLLRLSTFVAAAAALLAPSWILNLRPFTMKSPEGRLSGSGGVSGGSGGHGGPGCSGSPWPWPAPAFAVAPAVVWMRHAERLASATQVQGGSGGSEERSAGASAAAASRCGVAADAAASASRWLARQVASKRIASARGPRASSAATVAGDEGDCGSCGRVHTVASPMVLEIDAPSVPSKRSSRYCGAACQRDDWFVRARTGRGRVCARVRMR